MRAHRSRRVAAAVALAVLLTACSDDGADSPSSTAPPTPTDESVAPSETATTSPTSSGETVSGEPELTFGFIGPGVGLLDELAIGQDRGLQLAIDDINAAGGVLGAPVAAARVDEVAPDPIDGVVDQLVEQGADVLVGPVGSSSTVALLPILEERALLACSASATATSLTAATTPATFVRTALRDDHLAGVVADHVMFPFDGSAAPANVMVVGRDDVYGNELIGALSAELIARGAGVDTITYPARRVSFSEESAEIVAAAADRVILVSYTEAPNLIAQTVDAGYPVEQIVGLDGLLVPRLAEQTFPADPRQADGLTVIGTTGDRALMARLSAVPAPQDQTSYGGQMYDCVVSLALAAMATGSTEPATIGQALPAVTAGGRSCSTFAHCAELLSAGEDIDYDGTTGNIGFDGAGDISSARITTSTVLDGQLQPTASQDLDLVARRQQEIFASAVFVTQLQQALKALGYYEGDITGVYDEATTAAVAALQRDLGLPDTGQYDEATDAALRERLGVRIEAFGTSVAQLQQALTDLGFYSGPIDGRYSAATIEAVRAFQRDARRARHRGDRRGHAAGDLRPRHLLRGGQRADGDGAPCDDPTARDDGAAGDDGRAATAGPAGHRRACNQRATNSRGRRPLCGPVGRSAVLDAGRGARHCGLRRRPRPSGPPDVLRPDQRGVRLHRRGDARPPDVRSGGGQRAPAQSGRGG